MGSHWQEVQQAVTNSPRGLNFMAVGFGMAQKRQKTDQRRECSAFSPVRDDSGLDQHREERDGRKTLFGDTLLPK